MLNNFTVFIRAYSNKESTSMISNRFNGYPSKVGLDYARQSSRRDE